MTQSRTILIILTILVLTYSIYSYITDSDFIPISSAALEIGDERDFYFEDGLTTYYSEDGSVRYRLYFGALSHFPQTNSTLLDQPKLLFNDLSEMKQPNNKGEDEKREQNLANKATGKPPKEPWYISSNKGQIFGSGDQITLWDNVLIKQKKKDGSEITLTTEFLSILPEKEYAETNEIVKLATTSNNSTTTSKGMRAFLSTNRFQFSSQVETIYVQKPLAKQPQR